MSDPGSEGEDRRAFLEKAAKTALTAPAAALLLSASSRGAMASPYGGNNGNDGGSPGGQPGGPSGNFQDWWNNWWNNFWEDFWNRWRGR